MRLFLDTWDGADWVRTGSFDGVVELAGGPGYNPVVEGGGVELSMDPAAVESDPSLVEKYGRIKTGGTGTDPATGSPYVFQATWGPGASPPGSGFGKYALSSTNGVAAVDGNVFLLGGACSQVGLFALPVGSDGDVVEPGGDPGADRGEVVEYGESSLQVMDVCRPCVDCDDYTDFEVYMSAVSRSLDLMAKRFHAEAHPDWPVEGSPNTVPFGMFEQHQALVHYWNYMAFLTTIRLEAYIYDAEFPPSLTILTNHKNWSESTISPRVEIEVRYYPEGGVPQDVDIEGWGERHRHYPVSLYTGGGPPNVVRYIPGSGSEGNKIFKCFDMPPFLGWEVVVKGQAPDLDVGDLLEVAVTWSDTCFNGSVTLARKIYAAYATPPPPSPPAVEA